MILLLVKGDYANASLASINFIGNKIDVWNHWKGFCDSKKGVHDDAAQSCRSWEREGNDVWIIRYFPIGRHCAIEIYISGHDRLRRKGTQSDIGKPKGFSNVSETRPLISSAGRTAPLSLHPLWTLRINRCEFTFAFEFNLTLRCSSRGESSS